MAIPHGRVYISFRVIYTEATMGVLIKNPATEAKIRRLAARTGESLTEAIESRR
jgi:hypothetical protein